MGSNAPSFRSTDRRRRGRRLCRGDRIGPDAGRVRIRRGRRPHPVGPCRAVAGRRRPRRRLRQGRPRTQRHGGCAAAHRGHGGDLGGSDPEPRPRAADPGRPQHGRADRAPRRRGPAARRARPGRSSARIGPAVRRLGVDGPAHRPCARRAAGAEPLAADATAAHAPVPGPVPRGHLRDHAGRGLHTRRDRGDPPRDRRGRRRRRGVPPPPTATSGHGRRRPLRDAGTRAPRPVARAHPSAPAPVRRADRRAVRGGRLRTPRPRRAARPGRRGGPRPTASMPPVPAVVACRRER